MSKGVIYVMTTAVPGLIKVGKSQTKHFIERMRCLEKNGYNNVAGLKRAFAIEVDDYDGKEALVHEVFSKHRVDGSELFALDLDLVKQLLLAFDGDIVFPEDLNKKRQFEIIEKVRTENNRFNFYRKGIKNGDIIEFRYDRTITAVVVGEREVEYQDRKSKLSPLTREIMEKLGKGNKSGAYQGSQYWYFRGIRLSNMPDV